MFLFQFAILATTFSHHKSFFLIIFLRWREHWIHLCINKEKADGWRKVLINENVGEGFLLVVDALNIVPTLRVAVIIICDDFAFFYVMKTMLCCIARFTFLILWSLLLGIRFQFFLLLVSLVRVFVSIFLILYIQSNSSPYNNTRVFNYLTDNKFVKLIEIIGMDTH